MDSVKKHIYIAGPYRDKTEAGIQKNIKLAEAAAAEVFHAGHIPIVPHIIGFSLSCDKRNTSHSQEYWIKELCLPMLSRCDAIYVIGNWKHSKGVIREMEYAIQNDIPVFFQEDELCF